MRIATALVPLMLLCAGAPALAQAPAPAPAKIQVNGPEPGEVLAVLNFKPVKADAQLGAALSEVFRSALVNAAAGRFKIVDRSRVHAVLSEQALQVSDAVADTKAVELGQLLAAQFLIQGVVTQVGDTWIVTANLVDVESGQTVSSKNIEAAETKAIVPGVRDLAARIVGGETPAAGAAAAPVAAAAAPVANETTVAALSPDGAVRIQGHYATEYTYKSGKTHKSDLYLTQEGSSVHGFDVIRSDGSRSEMWGTIVGSDLVGYYRASYGYGNFSFAIKENGRLLDGSYFQVSSGGGGSWVARLVGGETAPPAEVRQSGMSSVSGLAVGQLVLANWASDAWWYTARVTSISGGRATVHYDDGTVETLGPERLTRIELAAGDAVFADWKRKGKYYAGTIAARDGERVHIRYADGATEWTTLHAIRVK